MKKDDLGDRMKEYEAREAGDNTDDDEEPELDAAHLEACALGGTLVAAHGVEAATECRVAQHHEGGRDDDDQQDE